MNTNPIDTSLASNIETWQENLKNDFDAPFIIKGITEGFSLIDSKIHVNDIQAVEMNNHRSATDPKNRHLMENQIRAELSDNNYFIPSFKPKIISAMGAIPKKDGSLRIIHDCSLPENNALNNYASKDPCRYQSVQEALAMIQPGWYMAKVDLQSAYRSVGISPTEYSLTGLKWQFCDDDKVTYLCDRKLPFGARKSPSIFNRITQSIRRMMLRRGFPYCVVLLDDFFIAAPSFEECTHAYTHLISLIRSLGFRINWKKVVDPTQDLVFLGVRINTVNNRISLDPDKIQEIITILNSTMQRSRMTKHQLQSLAGKLSWASTVYQWGRSFLCQIFQTIHGVKHGLHKIKLHQRLKADFQWWISALQTGLNTKLIWDKRPSVWCYSDASEIGGGVFCNGFWLYRNWQLDTTFGRCHINVKELAMAYLAIEHWAHFLSGKKFTVFIDNIAAVSYINRQRAPNHHVIHILRQLALLAIQYDIAIEAVYIPGEHNKMADSISRLHEPGQIARFMSLIHQYYSPGILPTYFLLDHHMTRNARRFLYPQVSRWIKQLSLNNWTQKWPSGNPCPMQCQPKEHIVHTGITT